MYPAQLVTLGTKIVEELEKGAGEGGREGRNEGGKEGRKEREKKGLGRKEIKILQV